jgi:hypothetical protein
MGKQRSVREVMDQDYLVLRAKTLELAAGLDRLDRASGDAAADPRWTQLQKAIKILQSDASDRAQRIQSLLSRPYHPEWRAELQVPTASGATPPPLS